MSGDQAPNGERLVLEGTRNTRDIGGYRTVDGMTIRRGVVFRSDGLDGLTESDVRQLSGLGIRTVIDLRGAQERAAGGTSAGGLDATGVTVHAISLFAEEDVFALFRGPLDGTAHPLVAYYWSILERRADGIRSVIEYLAVPENPFPALVHCSAGKDRTGIVVALLLATAGVDHDTIVADYARTADYLDATWLETRRGDAARLGIDWDRYTRAYEAPQAVISATLQMLDTKYGSVSRYLASIGVPENSRSRLRDRLRDPAGDAPKLPAPPPPSQ
jgi:protein-tyrosine phosphatase